MEDQDPPPPDEKPKTAAEIRKINKPLMEKKRRGRINNCLNQLKTFLMDATKKDSSYYSKLEKADILEMTVKYLKNLQRQQLAVAMMDPKVLGKYTAGYSQCATEVSRYLNKMEGFSPDVKTRLLGHLSGCVNQLNTPIQNAQPTNITQATLPLANQPISLQLAPAVQQQQPVELPIGQIPTATPIAAMPGSSGVTATTIFTTNNVNQNINQTIGQNINQNLNQNINQAIQAPAQPSNVPVVPVQLIPAKLPSGDLVFLLANTQNAAMPVTNIVTPLSIAQASAPSSSAGGPSSTVTTIANIISSNPVSTTNVLPSTTSVAVVTPQVHTPKPTISVQAHKLDLSSPADLSLKAPQPGTSGFQTFMPLKGQSISPGPASSPSPSPTAPILFPHRDLGEPKNYSFLFPTLPRLLAPEPAHQSQKDSNNNDQSANVGKSPSPAPIPAHVPAPAPAPGPAFALGAPPPGYLAHFAGPADLSNPMWRPW